nr:retrovirus-related Pol polyprotein from transposon TNT 1-94 [Tanacetum cinerariifolium]
MSSTKAEYVAAAGCCAQVPWIKRQLADYDVLYDKVPIFCDNTNAIVISYNPVLHSRTKDIDIRYHFIRDHILIGDIELHFVPTDLQLADTFTKPLAEPSFTRLVAELAEADTVTKSITFTLSHFDKPLLFDLDVFLTVIGIERSEDFVSIPQKETVKAGLATLGLTDENDTSLSSSDLINSSPVKINQYFKPTLKNETALTTHMCKVAKLSPDPIKSLLPPSREVNADDSADKYSSETSVQPVIQPEAPTDLKPKKKRITPSSKPNSSKQVRDVPPMKLVAKTWLAKETVATTNTTKSLRASDSGKDQSMPDDDLVLLSGFKTEDSDDEGSQSNHQDNLSNKGTVETLNSFADMPAQSDPIGHLQEEMCTLNTKGERPPAQEISNVKQAPPIPESVKEENALVLHTLVEKSLEINTSEKKVTYDEPPVEKLKFLLPTPSLILSPTPLNLILHEPILKPDAITMTIEQLTKHLYKTTSSIFFPTPLRESNPPRDPTPSKDKSKGRSFGTPDGHITNDDVIAQLKEIKRLADLKAEKEKSEKSLKKIMNPVTISAHAQKMAEYEAKRKKMFNEYNHQIAQKADQLPITKISYRVNSSKEVTIRITKGNDPLNLTIYEMFRLKTLGLVNGLKYMLWPPRQRAKALGILPPPEISTFGVSINDKKIKRSSEILTEVFKKKDVVVGSPLGVEGRKGLVIEEPELGVFFYNGNFDLVFQREKEFHLATTPQLIRLQNGILRWTPEGEEFFKKIELTIEARDEANHTRKIIQDNLHELGQNM